MVLGSPEGEPKACSRVFMPLRSLPKGGSYPDTASCPSSCRRRVAVLLPPTSAPTCHRGMPPPPAFFVALHATTSPRGCSQASPVFPRKHIVAKRLFNPGCHQRRSIRQLDLLQFRGDLFRFLPCRSIFLRANGFQHRRYFLNLARRHRRPYIPVKMHCAPLPQCFGIKLPEAFHQPQTLVRNEQPHAFQPPFFQVPQECRPTRLVFFRSFRYGQYFPKPSSFTPIATSSDTFRTSPPQLRFRYIFTNASCTELSLRR